MKKSIHINKEEYGLILMLRQIGMLPSEVFGMLLGADMEENDEDEFERILRELASKG
ncbi:hypothetical protein [Priestia flexa]|uniref:hypothetical protein n=1 Tax=Priestia flexa TaxID=86664 RepID=UPI003D06E491